MPPPHRLSGLRWHAAAAFAALALLAPDRAGADEPAAVAYSVAVSGTIDTTTERDLRSAIATAASDGVRVLIIRLDTSGGMATPTRAIVQDIIAAPMPVIVYVHPGGGRAGSAGLFITLAADIAAMAPATNIGAATPVRTGGPPPADKDERELLRTLDRKFLNDSIAFARSLAEDHGRNADLAEQMVRSATSVSATNAMRRRLVDVVAPSERELLRELDGREIKGPKAGRLRTAGLTIKRADLDSIELFAEDVERSSLWRAFALVFGTALTGILLVVGGLRGPRVARRWLRRRRARARRRRATRG